MYIYFKLWIAMNHGSKKRRPIAFRYSTVNGRYYFQCIPSTGLQSRNWTILLFFLCAKQTLDVKCTLRHFLCWIIFQKKKKKKPTERVKLFFLICFNYNQIKVGLYSFKHKICFKQYLSLSFIRKKNVLLLFWR